MDVALEWNGENFDITVENNDLKSDEGLRTAIAISLFTDRRALEEELPLGELDRKGWWADQFADIEGDQIGSKLWLLRREKQTEETRLKARDYALEALQWMLDDGLAHGVDVEAEFVDRGVIGLRVAIQKPQGEVTFSYIFNWNAEAARG